MAPENGFVLNAKDFALKEYQNGEIMDIFFIEAENLKEALKKTHEILGNKDIEITVEGKEDEEDFDLTEEKHIWEGLII